MLGKMLKYDLKAMSKTMLPFFLVIIGMTVLNSFFIHFEWMSGIIAGSSIIFGLFIALGVTALVMIITQFYHNVLGDEGYLTNTLPVGVDVILFSKLLSAMIWLCLSGVVGIIVLFITLATTAGASEFFSATFDVIQAFFLAESTPPAPFPSCFWWFWAYWLSWFFLPTKSCISTVRWLARSCPSFQKTALSARSSLTLY